MPIGPSCIGDWRKMEEVMQFVAILAQGHFLLKLHLAFAGGEVFL